MSKLTDTIAALNDEYQGDYDQVIPALVKLVEADAELRREVVADYVRRCARFEVQHQAMTTRQSIMRTLTKPVASLKPRFGEGKEERAARVANQKRADDRFVSVLLDWPLHGGKFLGKSTRKDIEASVAARQVLIGGHQRSIDFEKAALDAMPKGATGAFEEVVSEDKMRELAAMYRSRHAQAA